MRLFEQLGVDIAGVLPFDEVRSMEAESFVEGVLVRARRPVGGGGDRLQVRPRSEGRRGLLKRMGERFGFELDEVPLLSEGEGPMSSSRIRAMLEAATSPPPARRWGGPSPSAAWWSTETVGDGPLGPHRQPRGGRAAGAPRTGVYAAIADHRGATYKAAVNVGSAPPSEAIGSSWRPPARRSHRSRSLWRDSHPPFRRPDPSRAPVRGADELVAQIRPTSRRCGCGSSTRGCGFHIPLIGYPGAVTEQEAPPRARGGHRVSRGCGARPEQGLQGRHRCPRARPDHPTRHDLRLCRSQRVGEDDHGEAAHRADPAHRGIGGGAWFGSNTILEHHQVTDRLPPQLSALYPQLTVRQNLTFAASIAGLPWFGRTAALRRVIEFVELEGSESKTVTEISGGMQRRLGLAATLVHDPELLFLDEPTAGIDPVLRRKFWDHFADLRDEGRTVFVTTQYVGEAEHCDLVALIVGGRLVMMDTPEASAGLRPAVTSSTSGLPPSTARRPSPTLPGSMGTSGSVPSTSGVWNWWCPMRPAPSRPGLVGAGTRTRSRGGRRAPPAFRRRFRHAGGEGEGGRDVDGDDR